MNAIKRSLILSAGALSAALMLSAPATAAEGQSDRETRGGGDTFVQVGAHREQMRGSRGEFRGPRGHAAPPRGQYRGPRGYSRGHFRQGSRHWRRGSYWRGSRPCWRRYGHHPRYGNRYGHAYGYLGLGYGSI